MLVKAKIIDVEMRDHKGKQVADVILKYSNPGEAVTCTIWSAAVEKGEHLPYAELAGQECLVAVRVEEFNKKIQHNLFTGFVPVSWQHLVTVLNKPAPVAERKQA